MHVRQNQNSVRGNAKTLDIQQQQPNQCANQAGRRISLQFPPSKIRLQRGWLAMMQNCEVSK